MNEMHAREWIESYKGPRVRIMEVCGTHTHEIFKLGIRNILPEAVTLISGPGCPVCVTPCGFLDEAIWLAEEKAVTICTFGDLVRVPGSRMSLADLRSKGHRVKIVYSPMDAVDYAKAHPEEEVVFLSVGFETTTPAACLAVSLAKESGIGNFSLLTANKTMPKAYEALKESADVFLYPGHVNAVAGTRVCEDLVRDGISGVVAGFRAEELLRALAVALLGFLKGRPFFANCYPGVVKKEGNREAQELVDRLMTVCDGEWRGLGRISDSGLTLRESWKDFDARKRFDMPKIVGHNHPACRCGEVLQGSCRPVDCPLFGGACAPSHPVGACMVSGEGACSAYYQYGGFQI
ncbi:MAG: hydrogenase formation protein HypD [Lachnospiraceae bacterium]|nr:hydrogenase formation protein HypD [Lachnospiraceae bacterium]